MDAIRATPAVHGEMTINEVTRLAPQAFPVLSRYGIDSCCGGSFRLREAADRHGVDIDTLLGDLNEAIGAGA